MRGTTQTPEAAGATPATGPATGADTPDWIHGIDPRMEVMSAKPLVLSTPLEVLAEQRVTATKSLFVRNVRDLDAGLASPSWSIRKNPAKQRKEPQLPPTCLDLRWRSI